MLVSVDGLVANTENRGESDKILTLITRRFGKMYVYARGSRQIKSKFMAASLKFTYGDFVVNTSDKLYILQEATPKSSFFGLQKNINAMCLADYVCEVLADVTVDGEPAEEALRLTLNCLHVLSEGKYAPDDVKTVFELRMTEVLGINPDLSCCARCGAAGKDWYYLDVMNGELVCRDCGRGEEDERMSEITRTARIIVMMTGAEAYAADRIINADRNRMFSLPADPAIRRRLGEISEKYLLNHLERSYKTLDFYKEMTKL